MHDSDVILITEIAVQTCKRLGATSINMHDTCSSVAAIESGVVDTRTSFTSFNIVFNLNLRPWSMAHYVHVKAMALLATLLLCLPRSSVCARAIGATVTTAGYNTIASPMSNYCTTDFSQVSYTDVTAACPTTSNGASATCCVAFNAKACQYQAQVNDFGSLCPMMFINYLGAAGPYPAGYFVGPCGDGSKGFCIH